jgi:hypothetical protein
MTVRVRDVLVVVCVMALAAGITACAQRDKDSGVATAGAGTQPSGAPSSVGDRQQWLRCLEEHGAKMLDGKPDYEHTPKEQMAAAEKACVQYAVPDELVRPPTAAEIELWRKWAQCMRDNGIDMGDPDPNQAGGLPGPRSTLDTQADMQRAEAACANLAVPTAGLGK